MPDFWPFNLPAGAAVPTNPNGFPLAAPAPQPQRVPGPVALEDYTPPGRGAPGGTIPGGSRAMQDIIQQVADRKLNKQGRSLRNHIEGSDPEALDLRTDMQPYNISELGRQIDRTKDPKSRAILMEELQRLKDLAGNLMAPLRPVVPEPDGIEVLKGNYPIQPPPASFKPPEPSPAGGVWNFGGGPRGERRM